MISIPLNLRGIVAVSIGLVVLMILTIRLNSKEKSDYNRTTGQITYLDKELGTLPVRHLGKYRYLEVDGYSFPFEIFVGNESGDFKPKYEQIDNLKKGDTISVFYYETENTQSEGINRFIQFVDKDGQSFFERGDSNKVMGIVIIGLSIILTISGFVLWKLKKIPF